MAKRYCACTPGSPENGWHEKRCRACIDAEMETWQLIFEAIHNGDVLRLVRGEDTDD